MELGRFCSQVLLVCLLCVSAGMAASAKESTTSGLPIPRYVSLKSDHVNVRAGPTKDNDVSWVYTRAGLPVEITAEFENWRRVRDSEGAEGWVYHSLLSGRRTAVVTMKHKDDLAALYVKRDAMQHLDASVAAGDALNLEHVRSPRVHACRDRPRSPARSRAPRPPCLRQWCGPGRAHGCDARFS